MSKTDEMMLYLMNNIRGKEKITHEELLRIFGAKTASKYWIEQFIQVAINAGILKSLSDSSYYEVVKR